jgi:hypothetical protein
MCARSPVWLRRSLLLRRLRDEQVVVVVGAQARCRVAEWR